eukprot:1154903-Pelagomonas_calceolata.AAC.1
MAEILDFWGTIYNARISADPDMELWSVLMCVNNWANPCMPAAHSIFDEAPFIGREPLGRPPRAPGTTPVDTKFNSILMWMPLMSPGSGGARSGDFTVYLQTIPACR